jgi:hypothetical protein
MAVHVQDYPICRVLLAAGADPTIGDETRVPPPALARQLADKVRTVFRGGRAREDTLRIEALLNGNPPRESLDDLRAELAPSLVPGFGAKDEKDETDEEEEEGEPDVVEEMRRERRAGQPSRNVKLVLAKLNGVDEQIEDRTSFEAPVGDAGRVRKPSTNLRIVLDKIAACP